MDIKFCKTNLLIEHKELDGRFQFKFTHPLLGMRMICEKRSLSSIELRIELSRAEDQSRRVRIWVSLSAIILRSMRLQG
ncbi:unnamed protein product [Microthlaspi erraticum]|uniref:Uncharacterized protein n=1 Tax=Microthlaspi erraticum TaxID=1685480 RepID=A0A6D2J3C3_9BRAS|nr:unnamed protein product [Microthlaspi erraticum]